MTEQVASALRETERRTGRKFGDEKMPLLVSVRSGARISMPGMMDTVLNLGLNDETVEALAAGADERFAYDCYRRFIQMYADVVLGVDVHDFEERLEDFKDERGVHARHRTDRRRLGRAGARLQGDHRARARRTFPQDPDDQLWGAIGAVFESWMTPRAVTYRRLHNFPESWGTAVNVQAMVFGNMGDTSATGVAFTRNPSTGEKALYGEYLVNAQGEDVVAGIRTPRDLTEAARIASGSDQPSLEKAMPDAFGEFRTICETLERHYRDMQDLEFTIERGKLWMLQTRNGKRTGRPRSRSPSTWPRKA